MDLVILWNIFYKALITKFRKKKLKLVFFVHNNVNGNDIEMKSPPVFYNESRYSKLLSFFRWKSFCQLIR